MSIKIHSFGSAQKMKVAILIKDLSFNLEEIYSTYVEPLVARGVPLEDIAAISLEYTDNNKAPAQLRRDCLDNVLKQLQWYEIEYLVVADPNYFKTLTKKLTVEACYGYAYQCEYAGFESCICVLSINFSALFYNPVIQAKIDMSLDAMAAVLRNQYVDPGQGIIHSANYPNTMEQIREAMTDLYQYPQLTCDIETFSLKHYRADIGTIGFAWDQHNGIAFKVSLDFINSPTSPMPSQVKDILRFFFQHYEGELIYHGGTFDIKVLVYTLFMSCGLDVEGMLNGLRIMTKNIGDTKLISYLATNTTAGNKLKLKQTAQEFAGDYAQEEIKDITKIEPKKLLKYNLVDCLGTWYTYNKNYPIMVADQQEDIYHEIFIPSIKVIVQMELVGMPLNMSAVYSAEKELSELRDNMLGELSRNQLIKHFNNTLRTNALLDKNAKLKVKVMHEDDFLHVHYNPASNNQTRELLYTDWGFEIVDLTEGGNAAVGAGTLKKLLNKLKLEHNITDEELK